MFVREEWRNEFAWEINLSTEPVTSKSQPLTNNHLTITVAHVSSFLHAELCSAESRVCRGMKSVQNSKYNANPFLYCSFLMLNYTDHLCVSSDGGVEIQKAPFTQPAGTLCPYSASSFCFKRFEDRTGGWISELAEKVGTVFNQCLCNKSKLAC